MAMQRYLLLAGAASSGRSWSSIHLSLLYALSLISPLCSLCSSSSTGCCACSKPTVRSKRPELEATTNDVMLLVLQVASTSCHLLHGANGNVCQKLFSSTHSAFFSMHPSLIFPAVLSSLCTVGNHIRWIVSDMLISHVKGSRYQGGELDKF